MRLGENRTGVRFPATSRRDVPAFFACGMECHGGILTQPNNLFLRVWSRRRESNPVHWELRRLILPCVCLTLRIEGVLGCRLRPLVVQWEGAC
jgi:hypothetical protein